MTVSREYEDVIPRVLDCKPYSRFPSSLLTLDPKPESLNPYSLLTPCKFGRGVIVHSYRDWISRLPPKDYVALGCGLIDTQSFSGLP